MEEVNKVEEKKDEVQETKETGKKELRAEDITEEKTGEVKETDNSGKEELRAEDIIEEKTAELQKIDNSEKKELRAEDGMEEKKREVQDTENLGKIRSQVEREEKLSKTEMFESVYGGTVLDVPSKKMVLGGKVITISAKRDINAIAGEKLSREEIKERLITALKENGEKIIEDPPIVDPPIDDPEIEEQDKQEEKEEKKTRKFKPKYLIPLLIPLFLLIMANSCSKTDKGPVIEYVVKQLESILYHMDNPGRLTYNDNQVKAQEGMTSNGIEGNTYDGKYYNYQQQAEIENETSTETIQVEEIKILINAYISVFIDENSTQEQKREALEKLLEIYTTIEQIYLENQPDVEQYAEETIDALEAYPDENTEAEKKVVEYNLQEYMRELGLTEYNVEEITQLLALMDEGYVITVKEHEMELDNDHRFTVEAVKAVVKDQEPGKLKSAWNKMVDFVKGISDKEIEK